MGQLVNMRLLATVDDLEHIMLITNTNMHKMPYLCKGGLMIINFKRNNHVEKNVIGVTLYIDYLVNNEICFFRMKQCVSHCSNTIIKSLNVTNIKETIKMSNISSFKWLNQITCYQQGLLINTTEYIDKFTMSYEMDPNGPDIIKLDNILEDFSIAHQKVEKHKRLKTFDLEVVKSRDIYSNKLKMLIRRDIKKGINVKKKRWAHINERLTTDHLLQLTVYCEDSKLRKKSDVSSVRGKNFTKSDLSSVRGKNCTKSDVSSVHTKYEIDSDVSSVLYPKDSEIFVPYISKPGTFAIIPISKISNLINEVNGKYSLENVHCFEKVLKKYQNYEVTLHVVDERAYPMGVKFVMLNDKEMKQVLSDMEELLQRKPTIYQSSIGIKSVLGSSKGQPYDNIGILLSSWLRSATCHPFEISSKDINIFRKDYGNKAFGNRGRSKCMGFNLYLGQRGSKTRAMSSPFEGANQMYKYQYRRKQFNPLYQPYIENLTNRLSHAASKYQDLFDYIISKILPNGMTRTVTRSCRIKIFTMGVRNKCIGFANGLHADTCDYVDSDTKMIKEILNTRDDEMDHEYKKKVSYIKKWISVGPLMKATKCTDQFKEGSGSEK